MSRELNSRPNRASRGANWSWRIQWDSDRDRLASPRLSVSVSIRPPDRNSATLPYFALTTTKIVPVFLSRASNSNSDWPRLQAVDHNIQAMKPDCVPRGGNNSDSPPGDDDDAVDDGDDVAAPAAEVGAYRNNSESLPVADRQLILNLDPDSASNCYDRHNNWQPPLDDNNSSAHGPYFR